MAQQQMSREDRAAAHVLPGWIQWVQSNLLLSFLLLAEAYLLGDLMQRGWVAHIDNIPSWGIYHGVGVVLFFAAGATAAGIALSCSVKAAACFAESRFFMGLFNLFGLLLFATVEIWASLSERSANLAPTPADRAVLGLLHIPDLPVSPTVVVVALLLPIATIYYGFSQHRPEIETAQERAERMQRERDETAHKMQIRALQAQGIGSILHAGITSAKGAVVAQETPGNTTDETLDNESPRAGNDSGPANVVKMTKRGQWTSRQLKQYARDTYGVTLSDVEAQSAMRVLSKGKRSGTSYVAPSRVGKTWVDETVGAHSSSEQQRA